MKGAVGADRHLPGGAVRRFDAKPLRPVRPDCAKHMDDTAEVERTIAKLGHEPGGSLIVAPDAFTVVHHQLFIRLAQQHRLPAIYAFRLIVDHSFSTSA